MAVALSFATAMIAFGNRASELKPLSSESLLLDVTLAGDRAVAVGERGHILISDDYGKSWNQVSSPTRSTLTAVAFGDELHGWAVGHESTVLHTIDGGLSWERQYPPGGIEQGYLDAYFLDDQVGLVVGAYGSARLTSNGGESWKEVEISWDQFHLNKLSMGPQGRLYLALEAGELMVSGDYGHAWENIPSPYEGSLFGVLPLGAQTLLTYGLRGHVFRSTDGGDSWTEIETPVKVLLKHGLRLSQGPIVLAGQNGKFLVSNDAGRSFQLWQVPVQGASSLVECPDGSLLAVGLNGVHRLNPPRPQDLEANQ